MNTYSRCKRSCLSSIPTILSVLFIDTGRSDHAHFSSVLRWAIDTLAPPPWMGMSLAEFARRINALEMIRRPIPTITNLENFKGNRQGVDALLLSMGCSILIERRGSSYVHPDGRHILRSTYGLPKTRSDPQSIETPPPKHGAPILLSWCRTCSRRQHCAPLQNAISTTVSPEEVKSSVSSKDAPVYCLR